MRAGPLRHRVDIRKKVDGSWVTVAESVSASILTLSGRDLEYARAQHNTASHRVVMRYHPEIKTSRQLVWSSEGKTFGIGHVDDASGLHSKMTLVVEEIRS